VDKNIKNLIKPNFSSAATQHPGIKNRLTERKRVRDMSMVAYKNKIMGRKMVAVCRKKLSQEEGTNSVFIVQDPDPEF